MRPCQDGFDGESLAAAWQELAAQTKERPWLLKLLSERGTVLAAHYALWKERLRRLRQGERHRLQRRLQQRLGIGLAGAALLLALAGGPAGANPANTITMDGSCTLVDAITAANTDTATGSCGAGSGADTIDLQVDVSLTAVDNTTYGATGLPVITTPITIAGNSHTIGRSASVDFRIMAVGPGGNLTLNSATVSGGVASGTASAGRGGGVYAHSATLAVLDSVLSGNSASDKGGGIYGVPAWVSIANSTLSGNSAGGYGGGIYVRATTASIANSTLSGNSAGSKGGGIFVRATTASIANSTLSGNYASADGGGILAISATVGISQSTLSGNTANRDGGGIAAYLGSLTVANSILSGNSAHGHGGGIAEYATKMTVANSTLYDNVAYDGAFVDGAGGGVWAHGATALVANSTLSGNSAVAYGGGIYVRDATMAVVNSTLSGNVVSNLGGGIDVRGYVTLTLQRSLVAGNTSGVYGNEISSINPEDATFNSANYNLFGHDGETSADAFYNFAPSGSDITTTSDGSSIALTSILATTLAANVNTVRAGAPPGSPVPTFALPTGSPAIDKAPSADCSAAPIDSLDQRSKARNVNGDGSASSKECDIGAFELQPENTTHIIVTKQTLPDGAAALFTFRLKGPVNRVFTATDGQIRSTGTIPAGIYTLEEITPSGWDPAIPLDQMLCNDGSPLSALDLATDEVLVCHFLNYKRGNIIVKKATIPPLASPNFAMKLIDASSNAQTLFSLANGGQFDTGALSSVPTYKLLEPAATLPGGWKKKSIACNNGSPAAAIVVPPGGSVTCTVTNENSAPTNILLSNTSVDENKPVGTVVGALSASDAIAGDTHTFSFVNDGTPGANGNGSFQIVGNQLQTNAVFDYETKTSYNIKLKATDTAGQTKIKNFVIRILDKPG